MHVEAVHDDWEGFRIWLSPEGPEGMLIVRFDAPLFYANSEEGARLSEVENAERLGFPHVFWQVENSALLAEFHRQSVGTREGMQIIHYAFLSSGDCIDVLAALPPTFSPAPGAGQCPSTSQTL